MREKIGQIVLEGSRVLFLIHIGFAAANFGLTRESGIVAFNWGMGVTVSLWLLGYLLKWEWPRIGWALPLLAGLLLGAGWLTTAAALWDPATGEPLPGPTWLSDIALQIGTFDMGLSKAAMVRTGVLLGALLMATDLFSVPKWSRALLLSMAVTATGMVTLFYLQKIAPDIFELKALDQTTPLHFATFRYWGNGASFLNLMWPPMAGVSLYLATTKGSGWSLWLAATLLVFASLYVNLSKAGQALGIVGLLGFGTMAITYLRHAQRRLKTSISWPLLLAGAVPILILLAALPFAMPWQRWDSLVNQGMERNERLMAYQLFIKLLPEAGWTGFGPGTFQRVYLQYFGDEPVMQQYAFWVAHQDYIQTIVEWGYFGAAIWAAIILLGVVGLRRGLLPRPSYITTQDQGYQFSILDKISAIFQGLPTADNPAVQSGVLLAICLTALHAAVDFPMQIESLQFYFLIWIGLGWKISLDQARARKSRE